MEEKYKYIFLRKICYNLGLGDIESQLKINNIQPNTVDVEHMAYSYFTLENKMSIDKFTHDQRKQYEYYFSKPIEELLNDENVSNFLEETYKIVLFPKTEDNYVFYGPLNYHYLAPKDSIVLGFNYVEFDFNYEGDFDEAHYERETIINNLLNKVQDELAPNKNLKVAVIKYNEYSKKKVDDNVSMLKR